MRMALTVAIEGLSGCGKTTLIEKLVDDLRSHGLRVAVFDSGTASNAPDLHAMIKDYPLDHPLQRLIFWVLTIKQCEAMNAAQGLVDVVIADRFRGSTRVYNLYGARLPRPVADWVDGCFERQPDLVLFLDVPLEIAKQRKKSRTMEDDDFAERIARGYQEIARSESWTRIDATQEPSAVKGQCLEIILARCGRAKNPPQAQ